MLGAAADGGAGATRAIEDVRLGERLVGGGRVTATMQLLGEGEELFNVSGAVVSGSHSVKDPYDGVWKHAADVRGARALGTQAPVLHNLITEAHRIHLATAPGVTRESVEATDFMEIEEGPELLAQNLVYLNEQEL